MATLWVIIEDSFEYDDEVYYPPQSGGGTPVYASAKKETAEAYCEKKNFERFEEEFWEIGNYCRDWADIFTPAGLKIAKENKAIVGDRWCADGEDWKKKNPTGMAQLFHECTLKWYSVYEVDEVDS